LHLVELEVVVAFLAEMEGAAVALLLAMGVSEPAVALRQEAMPAPPPMQWRS